MIETVEEVAPLPRRSRRGPPPRPVMAPESLLRGRLELDQHVRSRAAGKNDRGNLLNSWGSGVVIGIARSGYFVARWSCGAGVHGLGVSV